MAATTRSPQQVIRERLAAYAHRAWAGWMSYLFSKSAQNEDGSVTIPPELVARWQRQTDTVYEELPPNEQKSDLDEADKMLAEIAAPIPGLEFGPTSPREMIWGAVALYWRDDAGLHLDWIQVDDVAARDIPEEGLMGAALGLLRERHGEAISHAILVVLPNSYDRENLRTTLGAINSLLMTLPRAFGG